MKWLHAGPVSCAEALYDFQLLISLRRPGGRGRGGLTKNMPIREYACGGDSVERIEMISKVARAVSNPTRVAMLQILRDRGEICVCDIADELEISQPSASKHLASLRDVDLVRFRRDGLRLMYEALEPESSSLLEVLEKVARRGDWIGEEAMVE